MQFHKGEAITGDFVDNTETAFDIETALRSVDSLDKVHNKLRIKD